MRQAHAQEMFCRREASDIMKGKIRQRTIEHLWRNYSTTNSHVKRIEASLRAKNIAAPPLDHLAIIDLPGTHTGIPELRRIFSALDFVFQGNDYLPEKQNDFAWMTEINSHGTRAEKVLPQIVIADFRLDEMPANVRDIIFKYSSLAQPSPAAMIEKLAQQPNEESAAAILKIISNYLQGRDWPLPTVDEFKTVREFNELIAWVLVFGRKPNHFTYSIHLMPEFKCLADFHAFVTNDAGLALNSDGGIIKGSREMGIEQGSTAGTPEQIQLRDGTIELPSGFVEFVWRFTDKTNPVYWEDYFTGFIANHANRVIQSLYTND
jgi:Domain of unknown function (DUF1338)